MYGYIYLMTNKVNGMMYVGQHKSKVFDENYFGSGALIKEAVKVFGRDSFKVEVLKWCETKDELNEFEVEEIKARNATVSNLYYNITKGGRYSNGFTGRQHTEETRQKMHETHHTRQRVVTEKWRKSISENHADMHGENNPMYGRVQSDSTKELIGKKASKRMIGGKWMNKDGVCSFVYLEKQQEYLDNGFVFGRLPLGKHKKKN